MSAQPESFNDAMLQWSDGVIECRAEYSHQWRRMTVAHRPGVYTVRQRCARCRKVERERDISEQGYVLSKWRRTYGAGYLLTGLGRLDEDDRAVLRVASLQSADIVEVTDDPDE